MCKESHESNHERCCDQGPQGVPGVQGAQGIQGVAGPQGSIGQTGMQGPQGLQGVPGKDCEGRECKCHSAYCNVYSLTKQDKGPYGSATDTVMFDSQAAVSAEFDTSMKNVNGSIKFLKHGIYSIEWIAQANITPPVPAPVPSFSFGLWIDGVLIPGSVSSNFTQSPNDDNAHTSGQTIVEIKAAQLLTMKNASVASITMNPVPSGSVFAIANASINIVLIKELP
jgi:hypothetical protein